MTYVFDVVQKEVYYAAITVEANNYEEAYDMVEQQLQEHALETRKNTYEETETDITLRETDDIGQH
jgi:chorismate mutase